MSTGFPGFVWGLVADTNDPLKIGRIRVLIPGMFEPHHPEWAIPIGWPGAGHPSRGSQYPAPPIGGQVAVFFEMSDVSAPPAYICAIYGMAEVGTGVAGPPMVTAAVKAGEDPRDITVIWDDDAFKAFVVNRSNDKRLVFAEKTTGSNITLNATDGPNGKSVTLSLEAMTSLSLKCNGIIDIDGTVVQINGTRHIRKGTVTVT